MNRPIRVLAIGCLVLFFALMLRATYVQWWQADSLSSVSKHENNIRVLNDQFSRQRGAIIVGKKSAALSRASKDQYKFARTYPNGPEYAQITGFYTRDWGLGGLESSRNSVLSGEDSSLFLNRVVDLMDNRPAKGGSIVTTINPAAQKAAYDGLKGKIGAVVALKPSTGAILAMVSPRATTPTGWPPTSSTPSAATRTSCSTRSRAHSTTSASRPPCRRARRSRS